MRSYSVAVASLALDAPHKWTDNALAHYHVHGVLSEARGVARRVSFSSLLILGVARELQLRLRIPLSPALDMAHSIIREPGHPLTFGPIAVTVDIAAIRHDIEQRLLDTLETAPTPRRGRPPRP